MLYAGYRWNKVSELYYVRTRYLNSIVGGFVTRDEAITNDPSKYRYCRSVPIAFIDPYGDEEIDVLASPPQFERGTTFHTNLQSLIEALLLYQGQGNCIKRLELEGHSGPLIFLLTNDVDIKGKPIPTFNTSQDLTANAIDIGNATYIGNALRQKCRFCRPCEVILAGCNSGGAKDGGYAKKLAEATGCKVTAAGGYCSGSIIRNGALDVDEYYDRNKVKWYNWLFKSHDWVKLEETELHYGSMSDKMYIFEPPAAIPTMPPATEPAPPAIPGPISTAPIPRAPAVPTRRRRRGR